MGTGNDIGLSGNESQGPDGSTQADNLSALRRVILPALCAVAIASVVEIFLYGTFHPTFWQKTTWLMHDPYRNELLDREEVYLRLSHLEDSDPDIISVGDMFPDGSHCNQR